MVACLILYAKIKVSKNSLGLYVLGSKDPKHTTQLRCPCQAEASQDAWRSPIVYLFRLKLISVSALQKTLKSRKKRNKKKQSHLASLAVTVLRPKSHIRRTKSHKNTHTVSKLSTGGPWDENASTNVFRSLCPLTVHISHPQEDRPQAQNQPFNSIGGHCYQFGKHIHI